MMEASAIIDATLALAGMAAVVAMGIRSLSDTSTNQEGGHNPREIPKAA